MNMNYLLTLKKDLPDFPAGTVFKYLLRGEDKFFRAVGDKEEFCRAGLLDGNLIDDENWFDKKIDYNSLTDLKCPFCGETKCVADFVVYDYGSDGCNATTTFYYACGHQATVSQRNCRIKRIL